MGSKFYTEWDEQRESRTPMHSSHSLEPGISSNFAFRKFAYRLANAIAVVLEYNVDLRFY